MTKRKNKSNAKNKVKSKPKTKVVYRNAPMSVGAQLGDSLQKLAVSTFKRVTGMGDYKLSPNIKSIEQNSLMNKFSAQPPSFGSMNSSFVFEHCEYIGDINGSETFSSRSFNINPLDSTTFPWLSAVAGQFETYQIEGMLVRFESTSGDATGSNTALGSVMAYIAYDVADESPTSKSTLLQYEGVVDAKPSENFLVGVECEPSRLVMKRLYVGYPPAGTDQRFYNFAKIVVANQGQQGENAIGELWLHYRIRFFVAKDAGVSAGIDPPAAAFGSLLVPTPSLYPFENAAVIGAPTLGFRLTKSDFGFAGTSGGIYVITLSYTGVSATTVFPSYTFYNCSNLPLPGTGVASTKSGWGAAATEVATVFFVKVDSDITPGAEVVISSTSGTFPTNPAMHGSVVKWA